MERFKNERLNKAWRRIIKKEKKKTAGGDADSSIPPEQRTEATFVPKMLDDFLQVGALRTAFLKFGLWLLSGQVRSGQVRSSHLQVHEGDTNVMMIDE